MCIIGLDGFGAIGDGALEIGQIGERIRDEINRRRREMPAHVQRAFPEEQFTQMDGTDGRALSEVESRVGAYAQRVADAREGSAGSHVEGCVLFGFSDGASTIYQLFERGLARSATSLTSSAGAATAPG